MKKIILSLVFVLATGTSFMNASSANDEYIVSKSGTIEILEEFGCARDCVDVAITASYHLQSATLSRMDAFKIVQQSCYDTNCKS